MIDLLVLFLGTLICIMGYLMKRLIDAVDTLEEDLHNHLVEDVKSYVTKAEMMENLQRIRGFMDEVLTPVNRKLESIEGHLRKGS